MRRTLIGGSRKMIVYDDLEPSEKIKVYDKGITLDRRARGRSTQMLVGYRTGDMWAPQLDVSEALGVESRALRRLHRAPARTPHHRRRGWPARRRAARGRHAVACAQRGEPVELERSEGIA